MIKPKPVYGNHCGLKFIAYSRLVRMIGSPDYLEFGYYVPDLDVEYFGSESIETAVANAKREIDASKAVSRE
jgi:hypothetical protein